MPLPSTQGRHSITPVTLNQLLSTNDGERSSVSRSYHRSELLDKFVNRHNPGDDAPQRSQPRRSSGEVSFEERDFSAPKHRREFDIQRNDSPENGSPLHVNCTPVDDSVVFACKSAADRRSLDEYRTNGSYSMAQSDAVDRPQAPTVSVQETPCILATESPSKDRDEVASQQFYSLCGGASRCTQPSPVNNRREAFAAAKPFVAGSGFETVKAGSVEYLCSEISRLQQALEDKENECTTALQKYDDLLRGHIEGFGKLGGAPAVIQRVSELQARLSDSAKERTTLQQQVSSLDSELLALARMLEATKREAALTAAAAEAAINHKSQEAQELQHANAQLVDQQLLKRLHLSNVGTNTAPDLGAVDSSEEMAQERLRWHRQLEYYHDREQHLLQQVNGLQQSLSSLSAENERNAKLEHSSRSTHQPHENHMPPPATTKVMMLPADIAETFEAAQSDLHEHLLHLREKLVANHMEGQAVQHRDFERRLRALSKGVEGQLESLQHASNLQESYVQGKACLMELDAVMKALKDEQKEKEANRLARESDFGEFAATKPLFDAAHSLHRPSSVVEKAGPSLADSSECRSNGAPSEQHCVNDWAPRSNLTHKDLEREPSDPGFPCYSSSSVHHRGPNEVWNACSGEGGPRVSPQGNDSASAGTTIHRTVKDTLVNSNILPSCDTAPHTADESPKMKSKPENEPASDTSAPTKHKTIHGEMAKLIQSIRDNFGLADSVVSSPYASTSQQQQSTSLPCDGTTQNGATHKTILRESFQQYAQQRLQKQDPPVQPDRASAYLHRSSSPGSSILKRLNSPGASGATGKFFTGRHSPQLDSLRARATAAADKSLFV